MVAKIVKFGVLPATLLMTAATAYAQAPSPYRDPGYAPGAYPSRTNPASDWRGRGVFGRRPGDRDPTDRAPPADSNGIP